MAFAVLLFCFEGVAWGAALLCPPPAAAPPCSFAWRALPAERACLSSSCPLSCFARCALPGMAGMSELVGPMAVDSELKSGDIRRAVDGEVSQLLKNAYHVRAHHCMHLARVARGPCVQGSAHEGMLRFGLAREAAWVLFCVFFVVGVVGWGGLGGGEGGGVARGAAASRRLSRQQQHAVKKSAHCRMRMNCKISFGDLEGAHRAVGGQGSWLPGR